MRTTFHYDGPVESLTSPTQLSSAIMLGLERIDSWISMARGSA